MEKFAKIFESERFGQLLVVAGTGDDGEPELKITGKPKGFGLSSICVGFPSTERGWLGLDNSFEKMDLEAAESAVTDMFEFANDSE
jgi:hypothetical protein